MLGLLLGTVATDILYVLIRFAVTLGHAELNRNSKVLMNIIISLTIGFISCAHPKKAIVQYTAIVGASMMPAGALMLAGLTEFNYKMSLGFLVYCVSILLVSLVGIKIQFHLGFDKCHDQDDEQKQNVLLPPDQQ